MFIHTYVKKNKLEGCTQTYKIDFLWEMGFLRVEGFHFSCENGKKFSCISNKQGQNRLT